MIIVFSSNEKGAMIQMATKVTEVLIKMGFETLCYLPSVAIGNISDNLRPYIIRYKKVKKINPYNSSAKTLAKQISGLDPSLILYIDNGVFSSQIGINLVGYVKQALIMHDAGTSHTSFNISFKHKLKSFIERKTSEMCNNKVDWIITCSPASKTTYCNIYPSHKNKVYMLPLGPHMPDCSPECPSEINGLKDYYLFFGRIDKYKGIDTLLRTYSQWDGNRTLVIAGGGRLQVEEQAMIEKDSRVILINRYIKDEEMPELFTNARAVLLPYKDATQSGILPIAYMCGKPVICSDVIGISQFVENGKTGFICSTDESFTQAYDQMEDTSMLEQMSKQALDYYKYNLDWESNLSKMLKTLGV